MSEELTWRTWLTLTVVLSTFVALCFEKYPPEAIVLFSAVFLWICGIVNTTTFLAGLSNRGVVTVGALFVVVDAVAESALLSRFSHTLFGKSLNVRWNVFRQSVINMILSAFINNTPQVAFFIPITSDWCKAHKLNPAIFMMPLDFACIVGGSLTLVGSSTNLITQSFLIKDKKTPLSFFEIGYAGLPAAIVSILYMTFACPKWLDNPSMRYDQVTDAKLISSTPELSKIEEKPPVDSFITEIIIDNNSKLIGTSVTQFLTFIHGSIPYRILRNKNLERFSTTANLLGNRNPTSRTDTPDSGDSVPVSAQEARDIVNLREGILLDSKQLETEKERGNGEDFSVDITLENNNINNNENITLGISETNNTNLPYHIISPIPEEEIFRAGDRLVVSIAKNSIIKRVNEEGVYYLRVRSTPENSEDEYMEAVIAEKNPFIGKSILDEGIESHYECNMVGIKRYHQEHEPSLSTPIKNGDTLLFSCKPGFIDKWTSNFSHEFFYVSKVGNVKTYTKKDQIREYASLVLLLALFVFICGGWWDEAFVSVVAATVLVALQLTTWEQAVASVHWGLIVMIGASLSLGVAMENSGVAYQIAWALQQVAAEPATCLFVFMLLEVIATELISNNAAAAMFYPIGIAAAKRLGVNYRGFVVGSCLAASAGFALPLGYQTHLMVMVPGGYSQKDFFKIGIPLDIIYLVISWASILVVFPFH